ncbi:MAG: methyltransferase domain-containing protein [Candidatus Eremiobacteraeota bacterium]|nr:methyltransferase domain-containing protein [Candidatus Eremiobacteraeota bacterium]MBV9056411.1 methyltransferase domain-containing protein [Candidatus Eremiobacteraeota bacterium]
MRPAHASGRDVALAVVRDVFPPPGSRAVERSAQGALDYRARKAGLSDRDTAFAAELAYGAIKMRRTLDWYLAAALRDARNDDENGPLGSRGVIREILRLALYELAYTRPDEHATVFEFVNLAKRSGHRGLGNLVNAVLRNFLRQRPQPPARDRFAGDEEFLATRYSLPTWIVRQWRELFGERSEAMFAGVNEPAAAAVVVNARKIEPSQALEQLRAAGAQARPSRFVAESVVTDRARDNDGCWWPQSESSAMVVDVLLPQPGETILDLCSGRGNKALQIGARLGGEGSLTCVERNPAKVAALQRRLAAAELSAAIVTGDATADLLPGQQFDRVLVDAPCSGVGIIGRHPEARWKKQRSDGERLAVTQRALLERAARHVHRGGVLVYAVCSTDPRETTEVVEGFLAHENFERGLIPAAYEAHLTDANDVLIVPGIEGRDGFYIARLERRL